MREIDISQDLEVLLDTEFIGLHSGGGRSSIVGGQSAADAALAALDISGYANQRSQVLPVQTRGASVLSPYIRHNLLTLNHRVQFGLKTLVKASKTELSGLDA